MYKPKKLHTRQAIRIAMRRTGVFNDPSYRASCRASRNLAVSIFFWLGLVLTIFTGGAALPITFIFLLPGLAEIIKAWRAS
jgi:hypothetical protein